MAVIRRILHQLMAQRTVGAQPSARAHAHAIANRHAVLVRLKHHRAGRMNIRVLRGIPRHPAQSRHASATGRGAEAARHRDLVAVIRRTRVAVEAPLALVRAAHVHHHEVISIRVAAGHAVGLQIPVRRAAEALEILVRSTRSSPPAAGHRKCHRARRNGVAQERLRQQRTPDRPGSIGIDHLVVQNRRAIPARVTATEQHVLIATSPRALLRLEPA